MTEEIVRSISTARAAAFTAAAALAMTVLLAPPAAAADYPSWDEVEAARADVGARETEATRIEASLAGLETEVGRLGNEAVAASAAAESARVLAANARDRADRLATSVREAEATAATAGEQLGRLGAQLYRSTGRSLTAQVMFSSGDSSTLLRRLEFSSRVGETLSVIEARATAERESARSLAAQADVAETERDRLATEAEAARDAAVAAEAAAEDRLEAQRAAADVLYAQLAYLRDTSAALEREYREGEAARAAYEDQEDNSEGSGGGGNGGITAPPPSGVVSDPDGARAYAAGAVAARGWGGDQYDCLVWLWNRESGWRADAYNPSSGAYGIPQSLPGDKMASAGADWRTNAATQIEWGLGYIANRYGSPCGAWDHSERFNWY
ncbi:hypothetical protein MN032_12955 [Agromyces atrinae]|uniref:aggregation-promoting factor C-terminal-like domain-containing protein n=1 Tax=Agromyces atrinae TaxID=592376 RepID=UPI001F56FABD|nr:hypothetical protein [Agromyces atrinae]MCI2958604.1 hypothetical protein [Agromyces atrinae]